MKIHEFYLLAAAVHQARYITRIEMVPLSLSLSLSLSLQLREECGIKTVKKKEKTIKIIVSYRESHGAASVEEYIELVSPAYISTRKVTTKSFAAVTAQSNLLLYTLSTCSV